MSGNKGGKGGICGRPGAKGVELYKSGKYEEAIVEFTQFLTETMSEDGNKKVAHYNRGMAYNKLKRHDMALKDGEECLKIDPFWAKGYKCKGMALEGMGKPRHAMDVLLDGTRMCSKHDGNTHAVLDELIRRLNRETGFLGEDLDLLHRKKEEQYCVLCDLFERDARSSSLHESSATKSFISCEKCKMVSYCCQQHREKDKAVHDEVCDELMRIKKDSEKHFSIHILPRDDALCLLVLKPKGAEGQQIVNIIKRLGKHHLKGFIECDGGFVDGNFIPMYKLVKFHRLTKTQQKELNTWNDLFTMLDKKTIRLGEATALAETDATMDEFERDRERALTHILTDPMTVFYAMKQVALLSNKDESKVILLHVVGAESTKEIPEMKVFYNVLSDVIRQSLEIVYIGPLLGHILVGQVQTVCPEVSLFRGTYQDYIMTSHYRKPDCMVAFFPGFYDDTYSWLPVVVHAVVKKIPFLVTCDPEEDYRKTKEWLTLTKPKLALGQINPFSSWNAIQKVPGSNLLGRRNLFSLLVMGGEFNK